MLARSMCLGVLISYSTSLAWLPFLLPPLRVHLEVLNHLRCKGAICCYPVAGLALVLASANTRPDQRIWAQIALDVGRDDFSCDAIARHEPLICPRHGCRDGVDDGDERKTALMSVTEMGQAAQARRNKEGL